MYFLFFFSFFFFLYYYYFSCLPYRFSGTYVAPASVVITPYCLFSVCCAFLLSSFFEVDGEKKSCEASCVNIKVNMQDSVLSPYYG